MKTKAFLLVCLFIGIGLTKLSAQPAIGKSGTITLHENSISFGEMVPLNCDIQNLVLLEGTVRFLTIVHYAKYDGDEEHWDWCKNDFHGELALSTGETFKVSDECTTIGPSESHPSTGHFNLVGNKGSHYIVNYTWSDWDDPNNITIVSVKCPGNK